MNQPLSGPGTYTPAIPITDRQAHDAALTVCEHVPAHEVSGVLEQLGIAAQVRAA